MAVEIGVRCLAQPEPAQIARVAGFFMRSVLGVRNVDVRCTDDTPPWNLWWGSAASALVIPLPPGKHEFADHWFLTVQPGSRGEELPRLLAIVVAATAALVLDGIVLDETNLIYGGEIDPSDLLERLILAEPRDASTVLNVLRKQ